MKHMLDRAIALAANEHIGQYDKAGMPYILHPLKVMHYLKTEDQELMCIAVLHDVVEDTSVTLEKLSTMFTPRVVDAVRLLTKVHDQKHEDYVAGIKSNIDAVKVRLADLRHNLDPRRMKGTTEKDHKRIAKYTVMYAELKEALSHFPR